MIALYRLARWCYLHHVPIVPRLLYSLNRILFATVLPPSAQIGRDVVLGYRGLGIVVHRQAIVGDRVNVGPKVTIGGRSGIPGAPRIEDDALLGSGAQILGPIRIGRGAQVGANAVVLCDVPDGATAVGVPARILPARSK
ncbi:serine O-acetyltransferase [Kinneretia aquatilis]|jgi:serine O-acetyltransferase|uniref:serine O-acetyltransferase n=1 Tax=Kinneretia aquatilis TaxID=2070761 RepID=UPI0014952427|nr:DapH/DapD/GlmU-related protein [Paucibacter aquatile]WIV96554.1 DapH/DapD/GlmU-related protein [Paucibacter aquatile]